MSWRLLTFSLLIFAAIATTIGLWMGDKLIKGVPEQANLPNTVALDPMPETDAQGNKLHHQPPQPLLSGKMGIVQTSKAVDWKIKYAEPKASSSSQDSGSVTTGTTDDNQSYTPITQSAPANSQPAQGGGATWISEFNQKMSQCRTLGFNDRPVCIRNTRQQYCGAHNAWGQVADCPG